jgi:hypothetical protein
MRSETRHSKPAAVKSRASLVTRSDVPPAGSPTMRPWPMTLCTTPGSGVLHDACTTQPTTLREGIARAIAPSGSSVASFMPRHVPGMPSKNHHCTPFIAVSTTVSGR